MTVAQLIPLAIQLSMGLMIFSVGLRASAEDVASVLRRPGLLLRSVLAMNVVMPAVAVALAIGFDLDHALEIALIALALAPVPPILPGKEFKAGGATSSVVGILVATALLSIVIVPVGAHLVGEVFGRHVTVPPTTVAKIVFVSMLLPLGAGMLLRTLAPALASRLAMPSSITGTALLLAAFVPVLIAQLHGVLELIGNYTIVAIVVFVVVGLAVGHALGGADPDDRTVLALSTSTRHPAVAMAIAHDAHLPAVLTAILLVLVIGAIVSAPYVKWRRRVHAAKPGAVRVAGGEH
jgi:BASS family bile acid:Na+ symporter